MSQNKITNFRVDFKLQTDLFDLDKNTFSKKNKYKTKQFFISDFHKFQDNLPYNVEYPKYIINFPFCSIKNLNYLRSINCDYNIFFNRNEFDYSKFMSFYYDFSLNPDAICLPYMVFKSSYKRFFTNGNSRIFCRPESGEKPFAGRVLDKEDMAIELKHMDTDLYPDSLVWIASSKDIDKEYRFWIVDGKVITYSEYKMGMGEFFISSKNDDAVKYVEDILNKDKCFCEMYCLDVALLGNGEFRLVECNSIHCSDFYMCDVKSLLDAIYEFMYFFCCE